MSFNPRAVDIFREAAELNRSDPLRSGSLLEFPNYGQLVMTGDLHGHRRNFERLQHYCDLEHSGARHVILHEIIHEETDEHAGREESHDVLLQAAMWKVEFPTQVHFLVGNHDLAQLSGHEITKNGRIVTVAFEASVREAYGPTGREVMDAICDFLRSLPLAGRTANRVFLSHSLPNARELPVFDPTVVRREPTPADLGEHGSAHALVWGRYQPESVVAAMREWFDVDYFLCGHQPQETGFDVLHSRVIILASDHNHGVFLPFDLSKPATLESLTTHIRPLASLE